MKLIKSDNAMVSKKYLIYTYQYNDDVEKIMDRISKAYPIIGYAFDDDTLYTFYPAPRMDVGLDLKDIFELATKVYRNAYPYFERCITTDNILLTSKDIFLLPHGTEIFDGVVTDKSDFRGIVLNECEELFDRKMSKSDRELLDSVIMDYFEDGNF